MIIKRIVRRLLPYTLIAGMLFTGYVIGLQKAPPPQNNLIIAPTQAPGHINTKVLTYPTSVQKVNSRKYPSITPTTVPTYVPNTHNTYTQPVNNYYIYPTRTPYPTVPPLPTSIPPTAIPQPTVNVQALIDACKSNAREEYQSLLMSCIQGSDMGSEMCEDVALLTLNDRLSDCEGN